MSEGVLSMNVNFEYYRIFYYVAKYHNFTKAAHTLGSSQPNVTRAMNCLEQQINTTLFVRTNRGIQLTPEGEKLYTHISPAMSQIFAGMLVYLAVVSAVAYSLWGILLKYNPVSKVAVFGFMNPVFGVILSALLLGEGAQAAGVKSLIALLLVSIGIYVVNKKEGDSV